MNNYILVYAIFTYLYMGHRCVTKVKGNVPEDISDRPIAAGLVITVLWAISPVSFIFHLIFQLRKRVK